MMSHIVLKYAMKELWDKFAHLKDRKIIQKKKLMASIQIARLQIKMVIKKGKPLDFRLKNAIRNAFTFVA